MFRTPRGSAKDLFNLLAVADEIDRQSRIQVKEETLDKLYYSTIKRDRPIVPGTKSGIARLKR